MTTDKKSKKSSAAKILEALPKSIEHSKILQNAATLLHQVQSHANDLKGPANDELAKLVKKAKASYEDLNSRVTEVSGEAKKQAKEGIDHLLKTWNNNKSQLPKKFTGEVDRLLDRVGLNAKTKSAPKAKPAPAAKAKKAAPAKSAAPKAAAKPKAAAPKKPRATPAPKAPAGKVE